MEFWLTPHIKWVQLVLAQKSDPSLFRILCGIVWNDLVYVMHILSLLYIVWYHMECFGMWCMYFHFHFHILWYVMHILSLLYVGRSREWLHSSVTFVIHALLMLSSTVLMLLLWCDVQIQKIHIKKIHMHFCFLPGHNLNCIMSHTLYKRNGWTELTFWIKLMSTLMMSYENWSQFHWWLQSKKQLRRGAHSRVDLDNFEVG